MGRGKGIEAVKNEKRRRVGEGEGQRKRGGGPFMLYFWLLRVQSSGRHTFAHRSISSDVPFHSTSAYVLLVSFPRGHVRTP